MERAGSCSGRWFVFLLLLLLVLLVELGRLTNCVRCDHRKREKVKTTLEEDDDQELDPTREGDQGTTPMLEIASKPWRTDSTRNEEEEEESWESYNAAAFQVFKKGS